MLEHKGYKSRKLHMAYAVMVLGTLGFVLIGRWPALATVYAEYCMFLLGAASIYAGSNAAIKWMAAKGLPVEETTKAPHKSGKPKVEDLNPPANPNAD